MKDDKDPLDEVDPDHGVKSLRVKVDGHDDNDDQVDDKKIM